RRVHNEDPNERTRREPLWVDARNRTRGRYENSLNPGHRPKRTIADDHDGRETAELIGTGGRQGAGEGLHRHKHSPLPAHPDEFPRRRHGVRHHGAPPAARTSWSVRWSGGRARTTLIANEVDACAAADSTWRVNGRMRVPSAATAVTSTSWSSRANANDSRPWNRVMLAVGGVMPIQARTIGTKPVQNTSPGVNSKMGSASARPRSRTKNTDCIRSAVPEVSTRASPRAISTRSVRWRRLVSRNAT